MGPGPSSAARLQNLCGVAAPRSVGSTPAPRRRGFGATHVRSGGVGHLVMFWSAAVRSRRAAAAGVRPLLRLLLPACGSGGDDQAFVTCARRALLCARFAAWYASSASTESTSPSVGKSGHEAVRRRDPEPLRERRPERDHLHVAEPRQRAHPPLELDCVGRPSRPVSVAAVLAPRSRRKAPARAVPCCRGSDARPAAPGTPRRARRDLSPRSGPASRRPSRCCSLSGPRNAFCTGHLLVEREADQQRERVAGEKRVRLGVAGEMDPLRVWPWSRCYRPARVRRVRAAVAVAQGRRATLAAWTRSRPCRRDASLVRARLRRPDPGAGARLAGDRERQARARAGADRLREDARRLPARPRPPQRDARARACGSSTCRR